MHLTGEIAEGKDPDSREQRPGSRRRDGPRAPKMEQENPTSQLPILRGAMCLASRPSLDGSAAYLCL